MKHLSSKDYRLNTIFNSPVKKEWRSKQKYKIELKWVWGAWRVVKVYEAATYNYQVGITAYPSCIRAGSVNMPYDYIDKRTGKEPTKLRDKEEITRQERAMRIVYI